MDFGRKANRADHVHSLPTGHRLRRATARSNSPSSVQTPFPSGPTVCRQAWHSESGTLTSKTACGCGGTWTIQMCRRVGRKRTGVRDDDASGGHQLNIILILVDSLNRDCLSAYNPKTPCRTPVPDAFAQKADVLVTKSDADDPLSHHGWQLMLDQLWHPVIDKAGRHPIDQTDGSIGMPQQQCPGIRGHRAALEIADHTASGKAFKFKLRGLTLCRRRCFQANPLSVCANITFADFGRRCTPSFEKCALVV